MACIYEENKKFRYQGKDGEIWIKRRFDTFEEAVEFADNNPQFGALKEKSAVTYLYFRNYKDGRERWETRFPKIKGKGEYVATFLDKKKAAKFRDLYLEKWQTDDSFTKIDLRNAFFYYKYEMPPSEDKTDEIKALKMQISILTDVLKEIEGDN